MKHDELRRLAILMSEQVDRDGMDYCGECSKLDHHDESLRHKPNCPIAELEAEEAAPKSPETESKFVGQTRRRDSVEVHQDLSGVMMVMTESDQMGCVLLSAASALKYGRAVIDAAEGAAVELRAVHARMAAQIKDSPFPADKTKTAGEFEGEY